MPLIAVMEGMEENTVLALGKLFEQISEKHKHIRGWVYGDLDDILAATRSEQGYPLLFLEVPDLTLDDNGADNVQGPRLVSFGVIVRVNNLDESGTEIGERPKVEAYAQAEQIVLEIYRVVRKWQENREFTIEGKPQFGPIKRYTSGNDVGYMGEMTIQKEISLCIDENQWEGDLEWLG